MILMRIISPTLYYTAGRQLEVKTPLEVPGGITALTGPNGSGKTTFARILTDGCNFRTNKIEYPSTGERPRVHYLEFNDIHSLTVDSVGYYQQRYEATMNDEVPTVGSVAADVADTAAFDRLCRLLQLPCNPEKKVNFLSSGELRKLLIARALAGSPSLLILDNPYIGLDAASVGALNEALAGLKNEAMSVMLVVADENEVPEFVDHRLYASQGTISGCPLSYNGGETAYRCFGFEPVDSETGNREIFSIRNGTVTYGPATILENVDWSVKGGERWSLSGANGSGKSTLLSLVCADNPKSYSSDITVFGRRRGTGESIWDIKRHIGYVSPEMQMHFHGSGTLLQVVANGLNDTTGLYVKPSERQLGKAMRWLRHFGMEAKAERTFATLSAGERQLALVARAMIKEPRLLILDEPMHALDARSRRLVGATIEEFLDVRRDAAFIMVTHSPRELPSSINNHFKLDRHAARTDNRQ